MTLKKQYHDAENEVIRLESARNDHIRRAVEEATAQATREADAEFNEKIQEARKASALAYASFMDEKESLAAQNAPRPVGTRYVRWERETRRWGDKSDKPLLWKATGDTGVLEVVTRASQFADNLASYSIPNVGDLIVRLSKKSGELGLKFVTSQEFMQVNQWNTPSWYPEGEDPNQAEIAEAKKEAEKRVAKWMENPSLV